MHVLILGGTGEARALAAELHGRAGDHVTSSLAGRVRDPALPVGAVRIGGFGGVDGLAAALVELGVDAVVDATHPFAAGISANAAAACARVDRPLLMLRRPGWLGSPAQRPDWTVVADMAGAARAVAGSDSDGTVLLTTGRRDLAVFAGDARHRFVIRTVDAPEAPFPLHSTVILDRGPYTVAGETALMREHGVRVLVTKDSGGEMTSAKLAAAESLGVGVVVVRRPPAPAGVTMRWSVPEVLFWLDQLGSGWAG